MMRRKNKELKEPKVKIDGPMALVIVDDEPQTEAFYTSLESAQKVIGAPHVYYRASGRRNVSNTPRFYVNAKMESIAPHVDRNEEWDALFDKTTSEIKEAEDRGEVDELVTGIDKQKPEKTRISTVLERFKTLRTTSTDPPWSSYMMGRVGEMRGAEEFFLEDPGERSDHGNPVLRSFLPWIVGFGLLLYASGERDNNAPQDTSPDTTPSNSLVVPTPTPTPILIEGVDF